MSDTAQAILARSGRTFHLASQLLPGGMRKDAAQLYGFCRRMDDLADEGAPAGGEQMQAAIAALQQDPLSDDAAALGWPVKLEERFPGISKVAVTLTRALAADTGARRIETEAELLHYAFGVAGTVGLMMCRILGAPPEGAEAASYLGIAMQLTNIARDVAEDWGRDRVYLPSAWVMTIEVERALAGGKPRPLLEATQRLLALAESYYTAAERGMGYLPWRARVGILAAAACYREIGVCVGKDVPRSWRMRTVVPSRRKGELVGRSLLLAPWKRQPTDYHGASTATPAGASR